ncbi:MAG: septum formation initiator family protein [Candidatus Uhrbacteria bacterium]|nr:septum formation initiator family protein [Candidatus Uhrbacteria bacterium]
MTTERRGEKTRSRLKIAIILNLVIFSVLGFGFGREYLRNLEIEQEIARMEGENDRLEADRLEAMRLIQDLSSTYYLEGEARTKRGLGEPGETMIIVKDDGDASDADEAVPLTDTTIVNPLRWYYYFFDHARFDDVRLAGEVAL